SDPPVSRLSRRLRPPRCRRRVHVPLFEVSSHQNGLSACSIALSRPQQIGLSSRHRRTPPQVPRPLARLILPPNGARPSHAWGFLVYCRSPRLGTFGAVYAGISHVAAGGSERSVIGTDLERSNDESPR